MEKNVHILISGKVQGVWFRANTRQKAEQLNIKGWVRNTSDGKVEAIFEGKQDNIKEMLDWCRQGPPLAKVEDIKIEDKTQSKGYDGFTIKH